MSRLQLTAMVVGGMVGAGIFSLPRTFAQATGPLGAVIAWIIAGTGMYMLARVFQALAERKPDIDAGVFAYAREGFGNYPGFIAAFGYWIGSCIGNVSYWVLIKSTLGAFFPMFGDGNTAIAIAFASAGIWMFHFLILRGVQQAAFINSIVTIAKIIPILTFLVLVFVAFEADLAAVTAERDSLLSSLNGQMRDKSRDWEVERRENAILRERINDLAAQVTAMTAALEGEGSAIEAILQMAPKPANAKSPRAPAGAEEGQPVTLAERIRALQSSARQNKAS
jgi:amino acid transporter